MADLSLIPFAIGSALILAGAVFDLLAAIGLNRLPNFFTRLHAATVGVIGGAVYPVVGAAILSLSLTDVPLRWRLSFALPLFLTAALILITAPAGSHALAKAAYRSGVREGIVMCDAMRRRGGGGDAG